jgi:hypothetical protein
VLNEDFRGRNADRAAMPAPSAPKPPTPASSSRWRGAIPRAAPPPASPARARRTRVPYDGSAGATARLDALIKTGPARARLAREHYLNLWVCPLGGGLLGYAQFPGGAAATDGVVCAAAPSAARQAQPRTTPLGRTCTHEVGHWLDLHAHLGRRRRGLRAAADAVADTPNQGGRQRSAGLLSRPCPADNGPHGDMFMDYMDYVRRRHGACSPAARSNGWRRRWPAAGVAAVALPALLPRPKQTDSRAAWSSRAAGRGPATICA